MKRIILVLVLLACCAIYSIILIPPVTARPLHSTSTNLISCWDLDEQSGTRHDSKGSNHLTDLNTVGYSSGVYGNAATFVRTNYEALTIGDNQTLSFGDQDFTLAAWVNMVDNSTSYIIEKYTNAPGYRSYQLRVDNADHEFRFMVTGDGINVTSQIATNYGVVPSGQWIFVVAWHDSVNNKIGIQVNNGTANLGNFSLGVYPVTSPFDLGGNDNGSIDVAAVWNAVLSQDDKDYLYNSGAGRTCSEIGNYPTPTPTATVTPIPTLTPTPSGELRVPLQSGNWMTLKRDVTYGDISIGLFLMVLIVSFSLFIILWGSRKWLR